MSVYRKSYRDKRGQTVKVSGFTVEFSDHQGVIRRLPTTITTKPAAREAEANIKRLVTHRIDGSRPPEHLGRWAQGLPAAMLGRLGEWGIIPGARIAAARPLTELLDLWKQAVARTSTSPDHVKTLHARAKAAFESAGAAFWNDIDAQRVMQAVSELGRTSQTKKHYWRAVFQAARWIAEQHLKLGPRSSPLEGHSPAFRATTQDEEHEHPRRALSDDEMQRLLKAAGEGKVVRKMTGPYRRLVYLFALQTGIRRNEIGTLTTGSFALNKMQPTVTVSKARAKSRKERSIPLSPELAQQVRDHIIERRLGPGATVFPLPKSTAFAMRADLEAAGIPYKDAETGEYADFHSLRHTFLTRIVQQCDLETARELAGHASITTTARYLHTTKARLYDAVMAVARAVAG